MSVIVSVICETEAARQRAIAMFRNTPNIILHDVEPYNDPTRQGNGHYWKDGKVAEPRKRKGLVAATVLSAIKAHPGLCTRLLLQLDTVAALSVGSVKSSLFFHKKEGRATCSTDLGCWHITNKGELWLENH